MNRLLAVAALAAALWGCDGKSTSASASGAPSPQAKVSGPAYTERIKIDDV